MASYGFDMVGNVPYEKHMKSIYGPYMSHTTQFGKGSLLQFSFEYVSLKHKQVDDYTLCMLFWKSVLFLPYLLSLRIRNDFTDLLFDVCSSREDSSLLREIRDPAWSNIIDNFCLGIVHRLSKAGAALVSTISSIFNNYSRKWR